MNVAIVGSRNLNIEIEKYIPEETTSIISGGADGIDRLAEKYADSYNIPKLIFKPEYNLYGRSAPLIRNRLIVDNADLIVAIWDGKSRGTKFTIDYALKKNKKIIVYINNPKG